MRFSGIRFARPCFLVGAVAAIFSFATHAQGQVIYQDSFSGAAADDLGTRTPDISATGATWITAFARQNGGSDDNAVQIFSADGTITKDGPNATHDAGALLPFEIQANTVYTLECTFLNNNSNWVAVGFASSDAQLDGSNGRHSNGNPGVFGGYAWALSRNFPAAGDQEFFNGPGTGQGAGFVGGASGGDFADPTAIINLRVVLDTADTAAITAEYFLNGAQIGGTQTLDAAAFTDISFVGLSSDGIEGNGPASVSSFSLSAVSDAVLIGDVDQNGEINFLDITPFIALISSGEFLAEADIDESGMVDFLDIVPFIAILSAS